jgi:WD40 repeat protein
LYIFKVFFCQSASIVAAGRDREVHIRDASSGTLIRTLPVEYEAIIGIAYRLDGKVFAAAGTSGKAQLFDRTTRKALLSWDAWLGGLSNIVFSPDGSQLAFVSNDTNDAKVVNAAFGR